MICIYDIYMSICIYRCDTIYSQEHHQITISIRFTKVLIFFVAYEKTKNLKA